MWAIAIYSLDPRPGKWCRPRAAPCIALHNSTWGGKHPKTMETMAILVAKIRGFIGKIWWLLMIYDGSWMDLSLASWIYPTWARFHFPISHPNRPIGGSLKISIPFQGVYPISQTSGGVTMALGFNMFKRFTMFTSLIIFNTWLYRWSGWLSPPLMLPKTGTRGPPRSRANWYIAGVASTYTEESTAQ